MVATGRRLARARARLKMTAAPRGRHPQRDHGPPMHYLITGATGFVGGHVAEACVRREQAVTALVRPGSDATELEKLGVRVVRGDFGDPAAARPAVAEAEVVVHCAAKVGDWGPVEEYR